MLTYRALKAHLNSLTERDLDKTVEVKTGGRGSQVESISGGSLIVVVTAPTAETPEQKAARELAAAKAAAA